MNELKSAFFDASRNALGSRPTGMYLLDPVDSMGRPAIEQEIDGPSGAADMLQAYESGGRQRDTLLQHMMRHLSPVHQRELFSDEEWLRHDLVRACNDRYGMLHYMLAPVIGNGAVIGTLNFSRSARQRPFDRADLGFASALAAMVSERLAVLRLGSLNELPSVLTRREKDVAMLAIEGFANEQIALHLGISTNTVKFCLKNIFRKLSICSRTTLASRFARSGPLPPR